MSVLAAIAVLALLIVVHELGHFLAARLQGIHVNRFSLGFGPILWKYQGKETEYAVRAIPLGGFVGFPDDDPDSNIPPNDPDLLRNRPVLDRAIVISAGVIANLIFAYLVFVAQFAGVGIPEKFDYQPGVLVSEVISQTAPAAQAGLRSEDLILAVDGRSLGSSETAVRTLMEEIQASPNQPIDLTVQRNDQELTVTVTPEAGEDGVARIGVQLLPNGSITEYRRPNGIGEVLILAAEQFQNTFVRIVQGFVTLITDFGSVAGQVAGPVKIVEQGAGLAAANASSLFPFTAIISINLAIINILPLPALDGGQLVFLLIEALRGKPLPNRIQENVMQTGLVLLLGLGIFLIVRDTTQLAVFQRLFQ
ncbi:RIP metalloprotease RseP [Thermocoleostomius sinensis]|jgi:membrane-associated protease RseP (regulator of RpoE activity)|uniref:Zinc metalloprotease n=1 Tax=Thermocoleostomius sinensis A174 TaxID=2016057 RepID=A0A9E8ZJJ8_9CYAN|nr:RIP metalloprotease RseP [Thermocoleostomius sinensis]WAL62370.1 RIP metalloprotease RseP [Thermocoleostomius sinensis A174]